MTEYSLGDIPTGYFFTRPVYLDKGFIITAPETPFSGNVKRMLAEWGFGSVFSDGKPQKDYAGGAAGAAGESFVPPDDSETAEIAAFYKGLLAYAQSLINAVRGGGELRFAPIAEKVKAVCDLPKDQRHLLLRMLQREILRDPNYLASHAIKSAILSITIGQFIKLPLHRLLELGVAALLHEAGMFKLESAACAAHWEPEPPSAEREALKAHPGAGYALLKNFAFPLPVCLAALEHHERENGAGYPYQIKGDRLSLYGKIIAVVCAYEVLTSSLHKDAKDPYAGMLDLLKNEGKQYEETIVRALVFSLSLYPIGLYVLLSSGKKAQVVDVNPANPRYPIVQVFGELTPDGKNKVVETSPEGVFIARPLTREEVRARPE